MFVIKNGNRRRGSLTVAAALALFYFIYMIAAPSAFAIPEGGASPDTPGTYAEASPKELKPGETIQFSVSGYPAGEILNVKIDDGAGYSDQTTAGTGVVHTQAIGKNGSTAGSFKLPGDISEGWHWLRFLASEQVEGKGVLGYTNGAGSASNTSHPTAFLVKGESVGGKDAEDSVVTGTPPGTDTAAAPAGAQENAGVAATDNAAQESAAAAGGSASDSAAAGGSASGAGSASDSATNGSAAKESTTKDSGASVAAGNTKSSGDTGKKTSASSTADASENASETAGTDESVTTSGAAVVAADVEVMTDSEAAEAAGDAIFEGGGSTIADAALAKSSGVGDAPAAASGSSGAGDLPVAGIIALAAAVTAALAAMIFAALRKPKASGMSVAGYSGAPLAASPDGAAAGAAGASSAPSAPATPVNGGTGTLRS
jgi:hypothetical protein